MNLEGMFGDFVRLYRQTALPDDNRDTWLRVLRPYPLEVVALAFTTVRDDPDTTEMPTAATVLHIVRRLHGERRGHGVGVVGIEPDPNCPHDCDLGLARVEDRQGYQYLVRCSCRAGQARRSEGRWFEPDRARPGKIDPARPRPDVDACLGRGWSLLRPPRVDPATLAWVRNRAATHQAQGVTPGLAMSRAFADLAEARLAPGSAVAAARARQA